MMKKISFFLFLTLFVYLYQLAPPSWMREQIRSDLSLLKGAKVTKEMLDDAMEKNERENGQYLLLRVRHTNGELEIESHPLYENDLRTQMMRKTFATLFKKYKLPDLDFIVSLHDSLDHANLPAPVFVFAKDSRLFEKVILIPDFEALAGNRNQMREVRRGSQQFPWEKREEKAIWRGATTGALFDSATFLSLPRAQLVSVSLEHPDLIDARFTSLCQCADPVNVQTHYDHYFASSVPISEHFRYKYQILADGNSCAYSRAYWQLFSQCVVFKQDSPHVQWYYRALKPYIHYLPVRTDFKDLAEQIHWARTHDLEAKKIGENSHKFARDNLRKKQLFRYLAHLLRKYARYQSF